VTTHSLEGILVLAVVFVLGILVFIFCVLWHLAVEKLKAYQDLDLELKDERKANTSKLIAPKIPNRYGHIESLPNPAEAIKPMTTPPNIAKMILARSFAIAKGSLSKIGSRCQSKQRRTFFAASLTLYICILYTHGGIMSRYKRHKRIDVSISKW